MQIFAYVHSQMKVEDADAADHTRQVQGCFVNQMGLQAAVYTDTQPSNDDISKRLGCTWS